MAIIKPNNNTISGITALPNGIVSASALASGVGGKVLQVVNSNTSYPSTFTSTTASDILSASGTTWETSITPSSTSSKILVHAGICIFNTQNGENTFQENRYFIHLDSKTGSGSYSSLNDANWMGHYYYQGAQKTVLATNHHFVFNTIHTTNTTDAVTYKFQVGMHNVSNSQQCETNADGKNSFITLTEIAG